MRRRTTSGWGLLALAALTASLAAAQQQLPGNRPAPDRADVPYGPHERNVLDFWAAESDGPAPLVVYIHGGGFRGGDKRGVPVPLLRAQHEGLPRQLDGALPLSHRACYEGQVVERRDPRRVARLFEQRKALFELDTRRLEVALMARQHAERIAGLRFALGISRARTHLQCLGC